MLAGGNVTSFLHVGTQPVCFLKVKEKVDK
jgi:hypothetical protein